MSNVEIRKAAKERGIPLWMVAEKLGMADYTLSRKLRHELGEEDQKQIFEAIDALALAEG